MDSELKKRTSPRDFFTHLLAIVTLYASAISFLVVVFQFINIYIPDPRNVQYYFSRSGAYDAMRGAISTLVVVFPVFIVTSWFLNKSYIADPLRRNYRVRKWLIYFTLFVTALIIIGDLVSLVNNLLRGELTIRFLLKVVAVFFVAGSIFSYYFWDLRKYKTD